MYYDNFPEKRERHLEQLEKYAVLTPLDVMDILCSRPGEAGGSSAQNPDG